MRRDQLEHTIRAACQIADGTEVIIVDSRAILGTYTEAGLPFYGTRSVDIDVLPIADGTVKSPVSQANLRVTCMRELGVACTSCFLSACCWRSGGRSRHTHPCSVRRTDW